MSTFANRPNNSVSAPMSESDNEDDNEQNASFNQQNESMMHKVKDVVSKLLHPSFLFSASGDTTRPKRKRTISVEQNAADKEPENVTRTDSTTNGHSGTTKSTRRPIADDEPQLTDDEDNNGRETSSMEQDLTDTEQQKKRRRTANYQQVSSSTAMMNGKHSTERTSPLSTSTNIISSSSHRGMFDRGSSTTPVLLQAPSSETNHHEGTNRLTSSKQRLNLSSSFRGLSRNYDPSQSPLFSVGVRKANESNLALNRTTTNLKSNDEEFSANYLLATGLANRSQPMTATQAMTRTQQLSTLTSPAASNGHRLLQPERQMFGANYASINSRRLPYIERLRRRTLQDCIRLNRTLDSEPLSISTIEEHTSNSATPIRKPMKTSDRECGIQCNISTGDSSMEPSKKIQRTFPPADIRKEALSIPNVDKPQTSSQTHTSLQVDSSITIEANPSAATSDSTKPKVLGNFASFSWPKFARAQDEYAKKHPEKCRADAVPTQASKASVPATVEKAVVSAPASAFQAMNASSNVSKMPIFGASPPKSTKTLTGPTWKCPSCTMENPAQTSSCSLCHGINLNYKRSSAIQATPTVPTEKRSESATTSSKLPEVITEEPTAPKPVTISFATGSSMMTPTVTLPPSTTKESIPSLPPPPFSTPFGAGNTPAMFGSITPVSLPATTKEIAVTSASTTPVVAPFGWSAPSLFGGSTAATGNTSLFPASTNPSSAFPSFGSLTPTTTTGASASPSIPTTTTTSSSSSPVQGSAAITFGSFNANPTTAIAASTVSTLASDKPPSFSFGTAVSAPAVAVVSSLPAVTTSPAPPSLFGFSSNSTTAASTVSNTTLPVPSTSSGFSFSSGFPLGAAAAAAAATASTSTTTASTGALPTASLFGSSSSSSSGFSFPSTGITTTTTSSSTPFAFGATSPPKTFAPPVISSNTSTVPSAFGSTASFGLGSALDKPVTSASSFSTFGSSNSSPFNFGGTSNTTAPTNNPISAPVSSVGATGGFAFSSLAAPASGAAPPVFGASPSTFSFGQTPSFPFGAAAATAAPTSNAPFQFSGLPTATSGNPLVSSSFAAPENNPFSVGEESASNRRQVIKAKRRAKQ